MSHAGRYAKLVNETYGGEGVTMKIYVYDEVDRFVTVCSFSLGLKTMENLVQGIHDRRAALDDQTQDALFD